MKKIVLCVKTIKLCIVFFLFLYGGIQAENAVITVKSGARQALGGFGASSVAMYYNPPGSSYSVLSQANRDLLNNYLFKDAKFRVLRLWYSFGDNASFNQAFIASGLVADAKKAGCDTILLAPGIPNSYKMPDQMSMDSSKINQWASDLASNIKVIRDTYGVLINVTGITNEPAGFAPEPGNVYISASQWPLMVKALRSALDSNGLNSTGIVATESANCDGFAENFSQAIKNDGPAYSGLRGFATHSYNMAATVPYAAIAAGKEYWITEGSTNGAQDPNNTQVAASGAARILNDFNMRVTHWVWFIGFEKEDAGDNATRLIRYNPSPFSYTLHPQYHYMKHIANTFDTGALFRQCQQSGYNEPDGNIDANMVYTYGKKPMLNACAAKNPDGSWTIAMQNHTSSAYSDTTTGQDGWAARTFNLTVNVEELAGQNMNFTGTKSYGNASGYMQAAGNFSMTNGQITVTNLAPHDLITLRSAPLSGTATFTPLPTATATPTATPKNSQADCGAGITVNGNLSESVWMSGAWQDINRVVIGASAATARFKTRWDASNLYLGVQVTDASIYADSGADLWEDESIEVYLDMNRDRSAAYQADDFQFIYRNADTDFFEKNNRKTGAVFTSRNIAGGYEIEASIPWSLLGKTPAVAAKYGFDLGVNDDQNGGLREAQLMWNGGNINYMDTSSWGDITLGAACANTPTFTATRTRTTGPTPTYTATSAAGQNPAGRWIGVPMVSQAIKNAGHPGGEGCQVIQAIDIDSTGQFLVFGTDVGGLWKSEDGGDNWYPSNTGFKARGGSAVAIDPNNSNIVLVEASNSTDYGGWHGLYLSVNKGESWSHVSAMQYEGYRDFREAIAFDRGSISGGRSQIAYWSAPDAGEAGPGGLYKSTNGGASWSMINSGYGQGYVKTHPTNGTVYVANASGFHRSTNGGTSFSTTSSGPVRGLDVIPSQPNNVYILKQDGVYVSTDQGLNFTKRTNTNLDTGCTAQGGPWLLRVSPVNPARMVIDINCGEMYTARHQYSTDGGNSWSTSSIADTGYALAPYNNRIRSYAWHPANENVCYSLGGDWPSKSTNGGQTFRYEADGYNAIMPGAIMNFNAINPDIILVTSQDYNSYLSTDRGSTWKYLEVSGFGWGGFQYGGYAIDATHLVTADSAGWGATRYLKVSHDSGNTWTDTGLAGSDTYTSACGDPADANVAFCHQYRTADKGFNWTAMTNCVNVFTFNPQGSRELYGSNGNGLVRSYDHGVTWTTLRTLSEGIIDAAYDHVRNRAYMATTGKRLYQYDLGTSTLTEITNRLPLDNNNSRRAISVCVDPVDPSVVYAADHGDVYATSNGVMYSTDAGVTWNSLIKQPGETGPDGGRESVSVRVHPITRDVWAGGQCYGIWRHPCPAVSGTPTRTPVITFTRTATATVTVTSTASRVPSATFTGTYTFTRTITVPTATFTRTNTIAVPTATRTMTAVPAATFTQVNTQTFTVTRTSSSTVTITITNTPALTFTRTNSPTMTITSNPSPSFTATRTVTAINTSTNTVLPTATYTRTRTNTPVNTATNTQVNTATFTGTATLTVTSTVYLISSATATATRTSSIVQTATGTVSAVISSTVTQVNTATVTRTITIAIPTATFTQTNTIAIPTASGTSTSSAVPTSTSSVVPTSTSLVVPTSTSSAVATSTSSVVPTSTSSAVPTSTSSAVPTSTSSVMPTATGTSTQVSSFTMTITITNTPVPTFTRTPTSSVSCTPSFTTTRTGSPTATCTLTLTLTLTATFASTSTRTVTLTATIPSNPNPTPSFTSTVSWDGKFEITETLVYPNPYRLGAGDLTVKISITLPADSMKIRVYSVAFRKVVEAEAGSVHTGDSVISVSKWKLSRLSAGTYYLTVAGKAGDEKAVSKPVIFVVLK